MADGGGAEDAQVRCSLCLHDLSHACYDVYTHPELRAPICLLCKDALAEKAVERDEAGVYEVCAWCRDGGDLRLCDACDRAFCEQCLRNNHILEEDEENEENDDEEWRCPHCEPALLHRLEQQLDASKWEGLFSDGVDKDAEDAEAQRLVKRLHAVEDAIEECDEFFETEAWRQKEDEIREELKALGLSEEELESKAEEELEQLIEDWTFHANMLARVQTDLQEEIDASVDAGLAAFYLSRNENHADHTPQQAETAVTFATVAETGASLTDGEREMYQQLLVADEGDDDHDDREDVGDDDDAAEDFAVENISDASVRAIVERYRNEEAFDIPDFKDNAGRLLPLAVRKALKYAYTPQEAALLATHFHAEDADIVDDLGEVEELEVDYKRHGRRWKRSWKSTMEIAVEAENKERLAHSEWTKTKLTPHMPQEDVAATTEPASPTGLVSRKKPSSNRKAAGRKRPRREESDRSAPQGSRARELKADTEQTRSELSDAEEEPEPERAKRSRKLAANTSQTERKAADPECIDLTSDNELDDDFEPEQPQLVASVVKPRGDAKRPHPVEPASSASRKRAVPVNARQGTMLGFLTNRATSSDEVVSEVQVSEEPEKQLVLNPERTDDEPAILLACGLAAILKPHQEEGVRFMWENVVGALKGLDDPKKQFGCILAHSMGLGKTLQVIAFLVTLLTDPNLPNLATEPATASMSAEDEKTEQDPSQSPSSSFQRALVVAPVNTIANWEAEFVKFLRLASQSSREVLRKKVLSVKNSKDQKEQDRMATLKRWCESGGILIIGYPLLEMIVHRNEKRKFNISDDLRQQFLSADVVVADEAHMIRNPHSKTTKAIAEFKTKRRIALTGSPLQNNLMEYYCMVNFVRPGFLGKPSQFSQRFATPIANGQHADSTKMDVRKAKYRAHVLHKRLMPLIHRRDVTVLQAELPRKREFVVYLAMSPFQKHLYTKFLELLRQDSGRATLFRAYQTLLLVWNHPSTLAFKALSKGTTSTQPTLTESVAAEASASAEATAPQSSSASTTKARKEKRTQRVCFASVARETRTAYHAFAHRTTPADTVDANLSELTAKMFAAPKSGSGARSADSTSEGSIDISDDLDESIEIVDDEVEHDEIAVDEENDALSASKERPASPTIPADWWREQDVHTLPTNVHDEEIINLGPKVPFVLEVIAHAARLREKVVIFSNSVVTLDFLEVVLRSEWYKFLHRPATEQAVEMSSEFDKQFKFWRSGTHFLRLDGSVGGDTRQQHVEHFNSASSKASVFLISTKAGNMGINLVGANRVIILDTSWNPANDLQALFRCYRYGQQKSVFVYRLLAFNSMEEKIYKRQVVKSALAARIVDKIEPDRVFTEKEHAELFQFEDEVATQEEITDVLDKNPRDPVLTAVARIMADSILSIRDHEPLLEDKPDEKLTEEEQTAAEEDYQTEIHPPPPPPPQQLPPIPLFTAGMELAGATNHSSSQLPAIVNPLNFGAFAQLAFPPGWESTMGMLNSTPELMSSFMSTIDPQFLKYFGYAADPANP